MIIADRWSLVVYLIRISVRSRSWGEAKLLRLLEDPLSALHKIMDGLCLEVRRMLAHAV